MRVGTWGGVCDRDGGHLHSEAKIIPIFGKCRTCHAKTSHIDMLIEPPTHFYGEFPQDI